MPQYFAWNTRNMGHVDRRGLHQFGETVRPGFGKRVRSGSAHGSERGSAHGSERGSAQGSERGSAQPILLLFGLQLRHALRSCVDSEYQRKYQSFCFEQFSGRTIKLRPDAVSNLFCVRQFLTDQYHTVELRFALAGGPLP